MAHILLPTDFSDAALHAAEYAVHLFGRSGNRYTLFHAYSDAPVMDPALAMSMPGLIKEADDRLVGFVDRFVRTSGAEGVERELLYGPLAPLVADAARYAPIEPLPEDLRPAAE